MKKIITSSALVAVLLTSVQADFDFGDVFKDMKKADITMSKNTKESTVKLPNADFVFGDVFKDLKKAEITMSKNAKESTVKLPNADFVFGDVFKDMKQ